MEQSKIQKEKSTILQEMIAIVINNIKWRNPRAARAEYDIRDDLDADPSAIQEEMEEQIKEYVKLLKGD